MTQQTVPFCESIQTDDGSGFCSTIPSGMASASSTRCCARTRLCTFDDGRLVEERPTAALGGTPALYALGDGAAHAAPSSDDPSLGPRPESVRAHASGGRHPPPARRDRSPFTIALLAQWAHSVQQARGVLRALRVGLVVGMKNPRFRNNYSMLVLDVPFASTPRPSRVSFVDKPGGAASRCAHVPPSATWSSRHSSSETLSTRCSVPWCLSARTAPVASSKACRSTTSCSTPLYAPRSTGGTIHFHHMEHSGGRPHCGTRSRPFRNRTRRVERTPQSRSPHSRTRLTGAAHVASDTLPHAACQVVMLRSTRSCFCCPAAHHGLRKPVRQLRGTHDRGLRKVPQRKPGTRVLEATLALEDLYLEKARNDKSLDGYDAYVKDSRKRSTWKRSWRSASVSL